MEDGSGQDVIITSERHNNVRTSGRTSPRYILDRTNHNWFKYGVYVEYGGDDVHTHTRTHHCMDGWTCEVGGVVVLDCRSVVVSVCVVLWSCCRVVVLV